MDERMLLRELRWGDFDGLLESYFHLYDERAAGESIGITLFRERPTIAEEVTWFGSLMRHVVEGSHIVVVADLDGLPVGSCTIAPAAPLRDHEAGHVGVLGIMVDHRHRGRGVGTALLRRALELARGQFEIVRLAVFADNTRAKALYQRLGFVPYGRLPRGIRRGDRYVDEEFMFLDLRPEDPRATPNR
jgi:RimJ/RimL family protein N-acetyltransferase